MSVHASHASRLDTVSVLGSQLNYYDAGAYVALRLIYFCNFANVFQLARKDFYGASDDVLFKRLKN